jgi:hypothetical protein
MKRLPFNTITILWGIVILLASCAFTTKTQKAQSETIPKEQKKVPTPEFLKKVKASKKEYVSPIGKKTGSKYYDFRTVDFENYEKPTFENLFTTYASLLSLSEHDELVALTSIKYKTPRIESFYYSLFGEKFSEIDYQQFHKGFPVYSEQAQAYKMTITGDSIGRYIWRLPETIAKVGLDVDTTVVLSSMEAFKIAKSTIPVKNDEKFIYEQSLTKVSDNKFPDSKNFKIYKDRLTYSFVFCTRKEDELLKTYEAFVDVQTGRVLYLKAPWK